MRRRRASGGGRSDAVAARARERHALVSDVFARARRLVPEARPAFLDETCRGDDALRADVAALLGDLEPAAAALETGPLGAALLEGARVAEDGAGREPAGPMPPRVGPYRVEGVLGRGGMGIVYAGFDERLGRPVALKSVPPSVAGSPERRERLLREGRVLALVSHPGVAAIHGLEEDGDRLYLVLERVDGESLAERLARGALPLVEALRVCARVAGALEEAHRHGVIHRDLKPANVMCGPRGAVKVLDFGLARPADAGTAGPAAERSNDREAQGRRQVFGTPGYMSPEQLAGLEEDERTDVWAFGCLLFECLIGEPAFSVHSVREWLGAPHADGPEWTRLPEKTPEVLRELLRRCLARAREDRLADLGEARRILDAILDPYEAGGRVPRERHSLPGERDAFVGRAAEMDRIAERYATGARLITLLGPGGSGKTRLARRFGWTTLDSWPGGVWFCDLSDARGEDAIASAVSAGLQVPAGVEDVVERLGHAIAARGRCLVVLDNFEQVADHAGATLGRWLDRAHEAVFLVTSRRRLGLAGEEVLPVEPLALSTEGVELFETRARAHRSDWTLTPENREAVTDVVRLLDGLPLAIELAAARVAVLSPAQIRSRISDRFALLTGGRPGSRQATLRGTIDVSWELLSRAERSALAQSSVFEGGFTLAAAEEVVDLSGTPGAPSVLDVVHALVDRSLVRVESDSIAPRFGLHATIREYAAERLREEGTAAVDAAEGRHVRHYAGFGFRQRATDVLLQDEVEGSRALARDLDNFVLACRRATARGDAREAGGALYATWVQIAMRGPYRTAVDLALAARQLRDPAPADRVRILEVAGVACQRSGRLHEARLYLEEAASLCREAGNKEGEASALCSLGGVLQETGDVTEAERRYEEALSILRRSGHRRGEVAVLGNLANLKRRDGRTAEARRLYDLVLSAHRQQQSRRGEATVLANLGVLEWEQGRASEAVTCLHGALAILRALGDRRGEASVLGTLASSQFYSGQPEEARRSYERALEICREIGARRGEGVVIGNLGDLLCRVGRWDDARRAFEEALRIHREVGERRFAAIALGNLANVVERDGRLDDARRHYEEALAMFREVRDRRFEGISQRNLGQNAVLRGEHAEAREHLDLALAIFREVGDRRNEGFALGLFGDLQARIGRLEEARSAFEAGERLLREVKDPLELARLLCARGRAEAGGGEEATARRTLEEAEALVRAAGSGPESEFSIAVAELRRALEA